jgi:hypothetical protein
MAVEHRFKARFHPGAGMLREQRRRAKSKKQAEGLHLII